MQYTTHFNLNLPEGTDIVNPLVQDNPNYSAIDAAMFANKQAVIGTASEIVSGTVHAITRSNTDSNYFKFTATGNWNTGDSMSVDGTTVTVYLSDGTTPATGAYIINTEVLAILNGSRVTLITSAGIVKADAVSFDNTGTGFTATNVEDALKEIKPGSVSVTADGIKTIAEVLNDLFALVDITKISANTKLMQTRGSTSYVYDIDLIQPTSIEFTYSEVESSGAYIRSMRLRGSNSTMYFMAVGSPVTDLSTSISTLGDIFKIIY